MLADDVAISGESGVPVKEREMVACPREDWLEIHVRWDVLTGGWLDQEECLVYRRWHKG